MGREHGHSEFNQEKKTVIQKYISLGEIASTVSHEMKNILISISGFCDLILDKKKNNLPFDDELNEIKKTSEMAKFIFIEMLKFSKIQGNDTGTATASINDVIEEAMIMLKTNKLVKFDLHLEPSLPPIPCHPVKIKQVIVNIILNGIDAMEDHSGTITVITGKMPLPLGIYIRIEDTGCGMSEEVIRTLFKPFHTTKNSGTGLGLSVSRDIIAEHNGYIHVSSTMGKGSIFTLVFLNDGFISHPDIIDL